MDSRFGNFTQIALLVVIATFSSCGGSSANTPILFNPDCHRPLGDEQEVVREYFGQSGACQFTAPWDFVAGPIEPGIDACSLRYELRAGTGDEQTPAQVQFNAQQLLAATGTERQQYIRLSWQDYFHPGFEFAQVGQKLARVYDADGGFSGANVAVLNENTKLELLFVLSNGGEPVIYSKQVNFTYGGVPVGEVIQFDLEVLLPTSERRGFARLNYLGNEILIETDDQVDYVLQGGCMAGFSGFWVGGNFSNAGQPATRNSTRYIDSVVASVR